MEDWYLECFLEEHPQAQVDPGRPVAGLVVVGVNNLVGITAKPHRFAWLRENFAPVKTVAYSYMIYSISHRNPEFWETPLEFNPEHFSPEQVADRPRYAYYPFGAGQRICLGQHFALLEAVLVLAEVAQRYRMRLLPGQQIEPLFMGTLRPCVDIMVTAEKRSDQ